MRLRHLTPLAGSVCLLVAYGCAGHPTSPIAPDNTGHRPATGTSPFGQYTLSIDSGGVQLSPTATAQALGDAASYDATAYFNAAPCTDCARIEAFSTTPDGKLAIDIALRHPYRTTDARLDLDVFDVRGILGVNGVFTFPGTPGVLEAPITTDPDVLVNADGYTTHFHESLVKGDATLNPYRRFFIESDPTPIGEGEFINFAEMPMASEWDVRRYLITPGDSPLQFDFVIEASYGQSAAGPTTTPIDELGGRMNPTYYNPEFNQKEAFSTGFMVDSTPSASEGGNIELSATILDWQQGFVVEEFYPFPSNSYGLKASSNVGAVSVEIPGLGIGSTLPTTSAGTGSAEDPMLASWSIAIPAQPEGTYPALLVVEDELYDPELITESRHDLRAFQVRQLRLQENGVEGQIPIAILTSVPSPATAPLRDAEFVFYGSNSYDPDLVPLNRYEFDWNYVGGEFTVDYLGTDPFEAAPTHRYSMEGSYTLALRVGNEDGEMSDIVTLPVQVDPDPIIPSPSVDWSAGLNLTGELQINTIDGPSDSSIAIAPNGTIHVVYVQEEEGIFIGNDIYVNHIAIPPSGTPSAVTELYHELVLEAAEPKSCVGVTPGGTVYAAWAISDTIYYSQRNGASWTEPLIAAAADGFGGEILGSFDVVSSGTKTGLIYEALMPENTMPARIYVLFREDGEFGTEGTIGGGFGTSAASPGTMWPSLVPYAGGFIATWAAGNGIADVDQDVFIRRHNGTTWLPKETIADDPVLGEIEPTTAVGPDGSLAVAWRDAGGINTRLAADGTTFAAPAALFANGSGRVHTGPSLVAGPNGAFACAVLEKDGAADPGTIVTLAFSKLHTDPSYYGIRTRALAANVGPVYLNVDVAGSGQDSIAAVVEAPQTGWNYIRLIRGTFVQP